MACESMHKFAASALGTNSLHAFSTSLDVPEEGIGSPSHIYKVLVVPAVTAHGANKDASNTVTCHSMSFPFALFYCHAVNPTRIYEVTLKKVKCCPCCEEKVAGGPGTSSMPREHFGV